MRFWIVKAGEPVPFLSAESRDRLWRAGLMSLTLAERGHEVVLWASLFDHMRKRFRDVAADRVIPAEGVGRIWCFCRPRGMAETSGCGGSGTITGWPLGFGLSRPNFHDRTLSWLPIPRSTLHALPWISAAVMGFRWSWMFGTYGQTSSMIG